VDDPYSIFLTLAITIALKVAASPSIRMAARPVPLSLEHLNALADEHGTPLQLYSEPDIRKNARHLFHEMRAFDGFKQFFAVKALPNPAILRILVQEGCGLDCSSTAELHIAALLGVQGSDIMYTSNYTSKKDLGIAFDQGAIINLDDASLVDHLVAVRGRCPELISFRLNPGLGRTDSETLSNVLGGPSAKFGIPPEHMVAAYRAAHAAGSRRFGYVMRRILGTLWYFGLPLPLRSCV
jgi:diaminopimelate decarboxylase